MKYNTDVTLLHLQFNFVIVALTIPTEPTEYFRVSSVKFYSIISVSVQLFEKNLTKASKETIRPSKDCW